MTQTFAILAFMIAISERNVCLYDWNVVIIVPQHLITINKTCGDTKTFGWHHHVTCYHNSSRWRILRISWSEHVTSEEVLRKMGTKRKLLVTIRKRQLGFLGRVMRKEGLENWTITGRIEGKRSRGRQRLAYLKSQWMADRVTESERLHVKEQELLRTTRYRKLWGVIWSPTSWRDMVPEEEEEEEEEESWQQCLTFYFHVGNNLIHKIVHVHCRLSILSTVDNILSVNYSLTGSIHIETLPTCRETEWSIMLWNLPLWPG